MKVMPILAVALLSVCRVDGQSQPGFAVNFVAPAGSSNVDGNTYSGAGPAVNQPQTIRYQQVYAASEFAYLTNFGGGWLFDLVFRGDATNGTQLFVEMPSMQVNVSTTKRGPDELSSVFSENVGSDDTIVRTASLEQLLIGGHRHGPEEWGGNTNGIGIVQPVFDAINVTNDSVSRVWGDVNANAGLVETVGLPTWLFFWPNPKLHIQQQTNSLNLSWPANPSSFIFQTSQNLAPQTQWQAVTTGIVTSNVVNTYTIPLDSAGPAAYFRLVSQPP